MKILVVGSAGYVGSALCEFFVKQGYEVDGVDLGYFTRNIPWPKHTRIKAAADLRLNEDISKDSHDALIYLCGHSSVAMCANRESTAKSNIMDFVHVLDLWERTNPEKPFIYASSSSVYGASNQGDNLDETWAGFVPINNYDLTKYVGDLYAQASKVNFYGLRFGTVNGCSRNLRTDVMINAMVNSAFLTKQIQLYNKHVYRPILGIGDLIHAVSSILYKPNKPGIYNLASFQLTAGEIAHEVCRVINLCGIKTEVVEHPAVPIEKAANAKLQSTTYDFRVDCSKFKTAYAWLPIASVESLTIELKLQYTHKIYPEGQWEGTKRDHAF